MVKLIDSQADGGFSVQSSDGADRVRIADVVTRGMDIVTGADDDFVRILRLESETMRALLGFGDDEIRVRRTTVTGRDGFFATFYGGDDLGGGDTDVFEDEGANSISNPDVEGFENT